MMKKKSAKDNLVTTLARQAGHTAGVIVRATQELAANAAAFSFEKAPEKLPPPRKPSSARKKKKVTVTPATRRSRKRSATLTSGKRKRS